MSDKLIITIIYDDEVLKKDYFTDTILEEIIRSVLSPSEKHNIKEYNLFTKSHVELDRNKSLEANDVKNDDILSLTKHDGGGGFYIQN